MVVGFGSEKFGEDGTPVLLNEEVGFAGVVDFHQGIGERVPRPKSLCDAADKRARIRQCISSSRLGLRDRLLHSGDLEFPAQSSDLGSRLVGPLFQRLS